LGYLGLVRCRGTGEYVDVAAEGCELSGKLEDVHVEAAGLCAAGAFERRGMRADDSDSRVGANLPSFDELGMQSGGPLGSGHLACTIPSESEGVDLLVPGAEVVLVGFVAAEEVKAGHAVLDGPAQDEGLRDEAYR